MLLVADDLTGAADSAGAFAMAGHRVRVRLDGSAPLPGEITVFDTDSRAMPAAEAFLATAAAVALQPDDGVFVKIDSTMRGHVRACVEGALSSMPVPPSRVVVCPAFPARGRTVVNGMVHVDGRPLDRGSVYEALRGFHGIELVVPTVMSDDDVAALVSSTPPGVLWVGSAGLATHLARRIETATPYRVNRTPVEKVAVVAGSQHRHTAAQLEAIEPGSAHVFRIDPRDAASVRQIATELATCDGLILTGGHTARAVLDSIGVGELRVGGEIEAGVPWSIASGSGSRFTFVTKAGAFGDEGTLRRAIEFLLKS